MSEVRAGHIPYTGVPETAPNVALRPAPPEFQRIQATPEEFGAEVGRGLEKVGQGLTEASNVYSEVAAQQALTNWRTQVNNVMFGDPSQPGDVGYFGLKGQAAMDARQSTRDRIEQITQQSLGGLYTARSQIAFNNEARYYQSRLDAEIGSHYAQQSDAWAQEVQKNQLQGSVADAALRPLDEGAANDAFNRGHQALVRGMISRGELPQDMSQASTDQLQILSNRTRDLANEITESRIRSAIGRGDLSGAAAIFEQHKDTLSASRNFDAIASVIEHGANKAAIRAMGAEIWGGGSPTWAGGVGGRNYGRGPAMETGQALDTIQRYENGSANPNVGYGGADLSKAPLDSTGFPQWEGAEGPAGKSHAAGLFQIEPAEWHRYAPQVGVKDFSPESQRKVAHAAYEAEGFAPWAPYNTRLASAIGYGRSGGHPQAMPIPSGTQQAAPEQRAPIDAQAPDLDDMLSRIPADAPEEVYRGVFNDVTTRYREWHQATNGERAALKQSLTGGVAMLQDGRAFNWDEGRIRYLLPKDQADTLIDTLHDAQEIGNQKKNIAGLSIGEMLSQDAANQQQLANKLPAEYERASRMAEAYHKAVYARWDALNKDPALAISLENQSVQRAQAAAYAETPEQEAALAKLGQPTLKETFAGVMLDAQEQAGLAPEMRHIFATADAQARATRIIGNPEQAPAAIKEYASAYGSAWPQAFRDLVTLGKLPAGYQALAIMPEADGRQLARALAAGRGENKSFDQLLGADVVGQTAKDVRGASGVDDYLSALRRQGASDAQRADVLGSITALANQKTIEKDGDPVANAVKAFIGRYAFLPNGGAWVPSDREDATAANMEARVSAITPKSIRIPPQDLTGERGRPNADDYVRELVAAPTWINTPTADGVMLLDMAARPVLGTDGQPIVVRFGDAAPRAGAPSAPLPTEGGMPAMPLTMTPLANPEDQRYHPPGVVPGVEQ